MKSSESCIADDYKQCSHLDRNCIGNKWTNFVFELGEAIYFTLWDPIYTTMEKFWKRRFYSENWIKCFPSTLRRRNLKTQQSSVILDCRLDYQPLFGKGARASSPNSLLGRNVDRTRENGGNRAYLDWCLRKIRAWNWITRLSRNVNIFEKFRIQNVFCFQIPRVWRAFSKSSVFMTD